MVVQEQSYTEEWVQVGEGRTGVQLRLGLALGALVDGVTHAVLAHGRGPDPPPVVLHPPRAVGAAEQGPALPGRALALVAVEDQRGDGDEGSHA